MSFFFHSQEPGTTGLPSTQTSQLQLTCLSCGIDLDHNEQIFYNNLCSDCHHYDSLGSAFSPKYSSNHDESQNLEPKQPISYVKLENHGSGSYLNEYYVTVKTQPEYPERKDNLILCDTKESQCEKSQSDSNTITASHVSKKEDNFMHSKKINEKKATCNSCGGTDLEECEVGCEMQVVCKDCGTMTQNVAFKSDKPFQDYLVPRGASAQNLPKNSFTRSQPQAFKDGKIKIEDLCSKLCLDGFMIEEAKEMFCKVYYSDEIIRSPAKSKIHIAAVCVFIVARKYDIPISVIHMRKYIDSLKLFVIFKKKLLKKFDIPCKTIQSLTEQIRGCIEGKGFHPSIYETIRDIIFLCRKAWLTQGRNREHLITIAAFYAYQSSEHCEHLMGIEKFRKKFGFPKVPGQTLTHCNDFFIKMAKKLPWVNEILINRQTFKAYINDILKYQNSLIYFAFETGKAIAQPTTIGLNTRSFQKFCKKKKMVESGEPARLMPPSKKKIKQETYKPAKIPKDVNLDSPILKETEFGDELDYYILTAEEQAAIAGVKASLWAENCD